MARREGRASRGRLGLYVGAITIGVGALVAINAYRGDLQRAVRAESRTLLGADLELRSRTPFLDSLEALVDSLVAEGAERARVTTLGSMVFAEATGQTRLAQLRAVEGNYPFYGEIETEPADAWSQLTAGRNVIVDPALLLYLDAAIGDSVAIGDLRFAITGTVRSVPGEVSFFTAIGPRAFVDARHLPGTGLVQFGSLVRYAMYLQVADSREVERFLNTHNEQLQGWRIGYDTVAEREEELTEILDTQARFLGLIGLIALLLGGIGVASAIHVYVSSKLPTVATLRCLGATPSTAFTTYLLEAAALGLAGAVLGAGLGVGIQLALPYVLADFLPVQIVPRFSPAVVAGGIALGVAVALLFALLPLLAIRRVSPLRALRHDVEDLGAWYRDRARWGVVASLIALAVALSIWQAPHWAAGLAFGGGVATSIAVLWLFALLLRRLARRYFPRRAPYPFRQGIANLFRPHNQTIAVTLAAGFGIFLLATVGVVQRSLLTQLTLADDGPRPNLVLFDVQQDQSDTVVAILEASGSEIREVTPIIPARIAALRGIPVADVQREDPDPPDRWAIRREYRHTYRDTMTATEELVRGTWWTEPRPAADGPARVSIEEDLAAELRVDVGDRITWDIQGVQIETEIASVRRVDWARFETNFFFVFEPGVLESAPQTVVALVRQPDETLRNTVQRDVVRRFPNVSIVDLASVQEALDGIVSNVTLAIRFMALFSIVTGIIVLIGAVATSRFQRLRESALLRTLGARSHQVRLVLVTEYAALGGLAAITGTLLGVAAGWSLVRFFFEIEASIPVGQLIAIAGGALAITMAVGATSSRDVLRQAPLSVLRRLTG